MPLSISIPRTRARSLARSPASTIEQDWQCRLSGAVVGPRGWEQDGTWPFATLGYSTRSSRRWRMLSIAVVTPSLNQACFVERTVESVLGQAYPDLEYIVC